MTTEKVSFPGKNGDFPIVVLVYQRVYTVYCIILLHMHAVCIYDCLILIDIVCNYNIQMQSIFRIHICLDHLLQQLINQSSFIRVGH